ncbi:peptidoglycan D,D-transpeptidase FtsI family protein [Paenibacillus physcomitrellae]|uniref:Penicillin-binding protein n=1 Tax=Paenibacillus physcomitrellae TaxID=1619311 RepID=A0ABQ1GDH3_9BACL|nr:penicillin-binding transpeptidase domain-containing protein [Paenibacillus physcomitrellae]GGA41529.1 penicillin-binding protein [Paenibacillus physcomitrellae]
MSLALKKRIFAILLIVTALILIMVVRLAWLQLFDGVPKAATAHGRDTSEMAVRQRGTRIELDPGRGRFVDASGTPLTSEVLIAPVIFPVRAGGNEVPNQDERKQEGGGNGNGSKSGSGRTQDSCLLALAKLLNTTPEKLEAVQSRLQQPSYWTENSSSGHGSSDAPFRLNTEQAAELEKLNIAWVKALPVLQRYPDQASGKQWLGFVAEQPEAVMALNQQEEEEASNTKRRAELPITTKLGAAGLEKTFDRLMRGEGPTDVTYLMDGGRHPLSEEALRVHSTGNPYYPLTVRTTIDLDIQNKLERLAVQKGVKEGAVVVLDAASGDIKAMVSLPFYNPNQVDPQKTTSWSNRAVKEAVPGSIFKTVTAAAALEAGLSRADEHFLCKGSYGKYGLSCSKQSGHGDITLARGFAESCNVVFGTLGERLSPIQLQRTADALGIGRTIGWEEEASIDGRQLRQLDQEEAGTVFGAEPHPEDGGVRAQTAIGQRSVRLSPLQAANLIVTLLHGGVVQAPRLVSAVSYANGTDMVRFEPHQSPGASGRISPRTAQTILGWMRTVVTEGTGRKLSHSDWKLAGKSGTAQVVRDGKAMNDQWFIGFGPYESPKYAAAVLVQSREPGSVHLATELFGEVMNTLAELDKR